MKGEELLYCIHFDVDRASPPDWQPDWEDAPLPYKIYRDLPVLSLSDKNGFIGEFGRFLLYTYGLTQAVQYTGQDGTLQTGARRFAPSGGGLYPSELYMYLNIPEAPAGVYHYDAAHHSLVLLREGNFDSCTDQALGSRCEVSTCFCTIFLTTRFWKNFFKYNLFSYRLQGLDAGVLIGQLEETAKRFGWASGIYYQFLDRALNHLLGINGEEESVYAVIPLSADATHWQRESETVFTAEELCSGILPIQTDHIERSERVLAFPVITELNAYSFMDSTAEFKRVAGKLEPLHGILSKLPGNRFRYDFKEACKNRFSPDLDFISRKITKQQAGDLLCEAAAAFTSRKDTDTGGPDVYINFFGVEGIQNGAYRYHPKEQQLELLRPGDHRDCLQEALTLHNVNLYAVPMVIHLAGERGHFLPQLGYRGYRIQQMETGSFTQRLLLAASAMGLGGHPLLGYDVQRCDDLYGLKESTCLIQIPIGPYRKRAWLKGRL
ncbi:SagB/ThcOx family dehydrogenase [Bacillus mangrovi]|uniref:SagB/ThcOx family dehydrogenase n=1 Tax=Metabacillus mangrovi TaxID=1491830 RepID=A0A7X2V6E0_9BACI|nr:SagB family peptide dehydrogenase [Metabacillus mangrovi]MTH54988.1 SagB/ThcOx family dehydrogenase [Metabacillus mangrovi]